jgi:hypothetical protein
MESQDTTNQQRWPAGPGRGPIRAELPNYIIKPLIFNRKNLEFPVIFPGFLTLIDNLAQYLSKIG